MPVYLIIDVIVHDAEIYAQYVQQVPDLVEKYGGSYLVRGGEVFPVSGDWYPQRIILIEFDAIEQVQEFFTSPEYQALVPLRERSTNSRAIIVEGFRP